MQAITLVTRALRILRVIDRGEAPEAEDAQAALEALNAMMRTWESRGVALGWNDIATIQDELLLPAEAIQAVAYNLAMELRPEYGSTLEPDVVEQARKGYAGLVTKNMVANPIAYNDYNLPYNILSDGYDGGLP